MHTKCWRGFSGGSDSEESAYNAGNLDLMPGWGRSAGEETSISSSILVWRSPQAEEPGGLTWGPWGHMEPMGPQRIRYDWVTNTFTFFLRSSVWWHGCQIPLSIGSRPTNVLFLLLLFFNSFLINSQFLHLLILSLEFFPSGSFFLSFNSDSE